MNPLYLHCGANSVTRAELYAQPEPTPRGPRHRPIHHADFIEELTGSLLAYGFDIQDEGFGLNRDGNQLFGLMQVVHESHVGFEGGGFLVGFRGSHDMSFPRGVCAGDRVFVCDNLAFSGEHAISTKHTMNVDARLRVMLEGLMKTLGNQFVRISEQTEQMRQARISDETAKSAIIEMARRDIINYSELGKVVEEWYSPAHEEHAEDGPTVWRLRNAATEALKPRNPKHPRLPLLMGTVTDMRHGKGPRLEQLMEEVALAA